MSTDNTWQGIPRNEIPWHPTVDTTRCTGCRECYNFCSHGVYGWDGSNDTSVVQNPFHCVVGCSSCAGRCAAEAISFPPLTILREIQAKYKQ
jgi:NAD-dependent dihydropyrimidine dehydrogenase PreA subunit